MQTRVKFETFNDGTVECFVQDEEGEKGESIAKLRFGNQVIGAQRYYKAKATDVEISRLIRVPLLEKLEPHQIAAIDGREYNVAQVQHIFDSHPKKTVLSLEKKGRR